MNYIPVGVCSKAIDIEVIDGTIKSVAFTGGCSANLKALSSLIEGMKISDAISKLKGITCGNKTTSCPDQLSIALEQLL